ncbi:MAG: virulence protein SciE type [Planctomycetes bacterium]|nr:virulence protein SciE type [Planctomycetota bacterium]
MTAEDRLRAGDVPAALHELQQLVRREPAVAKHRIFLFQLLAILGQWDRARTQLHVLKDMDATAIPMVKTYLEALRCEVLRAGVWRGEHTPLVFGQPEPWMAGMVQALALSATGKVEQAQEMRAAALEQATAFSGTVEWGRPVAGGAAESPAESVERASFGWLADADPRLGPVLEAIVNGKYYWAPWSAVGELTIEAPTDLRDFVWVPAQIRWRNGGEVVALLPSRYPTSESSTDGALQLCRRTEWLDAGHGEYRGLGQKLLASEAGEWGLLDVRKVVMNATA